MNEPLDHHGPLEGMCFLGLNFTHEQFQEISLAMVERMDPKGEFGVEGAIVSAFAEVARLRGVIEWAVERLDSRKWQPTDSAERAAHSALLTLHAALLSPQPVQEKNA